MKKSDLKHLLSEQQINELEYINAINKLESLSSHSPLEQFKWLNITTSVALLVAGISFFIAANWQDMGKFFRLGLAQAIFVATFTPFLLKKPSKPLQMAAFIFQATLPGLIFMIFGQEYQTGADAWQLFALWSFLSFVPSLLSLHSGLWFAWILLLNLTMQLFISQYYGFYDPLILQASALINVFFVILMEFFYFKKRWEISRRVIGLSLLIVVYIFSFLTIEFIFEPQSKVYIMPILSPILYVCVIVPMLYYYHKVVYDIVLQSVALLSVIIVVTFWFIEIFDDIDLPLFFALLIIIEAYIASKWLKYSNAKNKERLQAANNA